MAVLSCDVASRCSTVESLLTLQDTGVIDALDSAFGEWVARRGGDAAGLAAALVSAEVAKGHVCLDLGTAADLLHAHAIEPPTHWAAGLAMSTAVAAPGGRAPLVLDGKQLYLHRYWRHETRVAEALLRLAEPVPEPDPATLARHLHELFPGIDDAGLDDQALAAVLGVTRRLTIISGGPGTGKTRTVLRMLLMLIKDHAERGQAAPVIRLSAPTGKAAQRLSEALRDGVRTLREHAQQALPATWHPYLQWALAAEAGTLHRLLGSHGRRGGFRHHADNPIVADIVIVDEASMIDLAMLHVLLDALKNDTALILVGDADQLTSVGTGSVLRDLVTALEAQAAPELVRLQHSFRAATALLPINAALLAGDEEAFAIAWHNAAAKAVRRKVTSRQELHRALGAWSVRLQQLLQRIGACEAVPIARQDLVLQALDGLRARQLLCALREGEFGSEQVNAALERILGRQLGDAPGAIWYPGRAVMIIHNNDSLGLFNGDVGLCLRDEQGNLGVWFEVSMPRGMLESPEPTHPGSETKRRVARFAPSSLPEHRGAFAVTIHKSQGSEYGHVAVLLPPDAESRILSRQLLYTGVSRARQVIEVWSSDAALDTAIATPVKRSGGLYRRFMADY